MGPLLFLFFQGCLVFGGAKRALRTLAVFGFELERERGCARSGLTFLFFRRVAAPVIVWEYDEMQPPDAAEKKERVAKRSVSA